MVNTLHTGGSGYDDDKNSHYFLNYLKQWRVFFVLTTNTKNKYLISCNFDGCQCLFNIWYSVICLLCNTLFVSYPNHELYSTIYE
jgi:hypothetical protein